MKEKMIAKRQSGKSHSQPPQSCDNAGIDWDRNNKLSKVYHKLAELTPNHGATK
jgi:hypothetical protein